MKHRFTVFTATYNRAHTLPRVFNSLSAQTFRDFEWVIVDDGSTDDTAELVSRWQQEAEFPILYFQQENLHKKTAFNRGVTEASGELFQNADSDDELVPTALEKLNEMWLSIPEGERQGFAGVCGLCQTSDGKVIGDRFPEDVFDSTLPETKHRYRISGDKCGSVRTDLLRSHQFPEHLQGLVPESVVWHDIARNYRTRFFNERLRIVHLGEDQLTGGQNVKPNVEGLTYWAAFTLEEELNEWLFSDPKWFVKMASNYTRFKLQVSSDRAANLKKVEALPARILVALCAPLGVALYVRDVKRARK